MGILESMFSMLFNYTAQNTFQDSYSPQKLNSSFVVTTLLK